MLDSDRLLLSSPQAQNNGTDIVSAPYIKDLQEDIFLLCYRLVCRFCLCVSRVGEERLAAFIEVLAIDISNIHLAILYAFHERI